MNQQETFIIADLHLGHRAIVEKRGFADLKEMHARIKDNWQATVGKADGVIILGDVAWNVGALNELKGLNGTKRLIMGNHDTLSQTAYREVFNSLHGCMEREEVILTHIPIHSSQMKGQGGRWEANIHGHLHEDDLGDARYICVSCEQVNYTPVEIGAILKKIEQRDL